MNKSRCFGARCGTEQSAAIKQKCEALKLTQSDYARLMLLYPTRLLPENDLAGIRNPRNLIVLKRADLEKGLRVLASYGNLAKQGVRAKNVIAHQINLGAVMQPREGTTRMREASDFFNKVNALADRIATFFAAIKTNANSYMLGGYPTKKSSYFGARCDQNQYDTIKGNIAILGIPKSDYTRLMLLYPVADLRELDRPILVDTASFKQGVQTLRAYGNLTNKALHEMNYLYSQIRKDNKMAEDEGARRMSAASDYFNEADVLKDKITSLFLAIAKNPNTYMKGGR